MIRHPRTVSLCLLLSLAAAATAQDKPLDKDHAARMARGLQIFKDKVRPVLVARCLKCHGGKNVESEFDLSDRAPLLKGGVAGPGIVPGKHKDSLVYQLVAQTKEPHMPWQGKKLPDSDIAALAEWIDAGAPFDSPLVPRADAAGWTKKVVPGEAKQFWAFQPLRRAEPPKVKNTDWVRTPIDAFILHKLEARGIEPNPALDRRRLIRRLSFDLVGLPPTPEEVESFVSDTSPDALEKLVDRLLASERHGERWGRHWLDLARFAESHGFEHDYDRPTAYHYRDFVIEALNRDLPFDTFVKWQIAGDELAPNDPLALKATGFLAAGVHSTQITKNEVEKHRYDELDDIVSTIGTAMLGLTVGCARCHDHKFDPLPQADYYRLVSAFTTTVRSEIDLPLDAAEHRKALAAWEKAHTPLTAALDRFEKDQLPERFRAWQASGQKPQAAWLLPELVSSKSAGEATFTPQADGSLLVTGKNAKFDTYTFVFHTSQVGVRALRLDALSHPSLVKGGPGRAANGNFALGDVRVSIAPKGQPSRTATVKLTAARATFEQKGLPVAAAIDGDVRSSWAVDPQFGKDHSAVFTFEKPIGHPEGSVLTVTLQFQNNDGHNLGRPRLSLGANPEADLKAELLPEAIPTALAAPKRTEEQTAMLHRWYRTQDAEWQKLHRSVQESLARQPRPKTVKALISSEGLPAIRLHSQGDDFLSQTHYLRRGDPNQKDGVAPLGYLQVLNFATEGDARWAAKPPPGARSSFRRTALADWLTDVDHGAGRLLARVIVNRLWLYHMGRGLVTTASDFGTRGATPTHPELLDWLASELIRGGWKLRPIHKLIVTSNVYLQSPDRDRSRESKDRDNLLWWRRPAQRLEAEAIRDALLTISGTLDTRMYGPGTLDESMKRRSVYFTMKRSQLIPFLQVFDAPDGLTGMAERPETTVAPQALLLMNHPQVRQYARRFADRIDDSKPADAVRRAYQGALGRAPTPAELKDAEGFLTRQSELYRKAGKADDAKLALADFCQVLFCLNEFIYVD